MLVHISFFPSFWFSPFVIVIACIFLLETFLDKTFPHEHLMILFCHKGKQQKLTSSHYLQLD